MQKKLVNLFGREINCLRLSVAANYNLSHFYCRSNPAECNAGEGKMLLTVEDYHSIGEVAVGLGITSIRLTGGEPLLRRDIVNIVRALAAIPGLEDLSLTTNGAFLPEMAFPLAAAGLQRVNINLDSLDEVNYRQLTGGGRLDRVLKGIERSMEAGLAPIKINMVLLKGINDHELQQFVNLTQKQDLCVRFIEYIPICTRKDNWSKNFIAIEEAKQAIEKTEKLFPIEGKYDGDSARYYCLEGGKGKFGFISPLSCHSCGLCSRLRVTFDGRLKSCLFSPDGVELRSLLSHPNREYSKEKIREAFKEHFRDIHHAPAILTGKNYRGCYRICGSW